MSATESSMYTQETTSVAHRKEKMKNERADDDDGDQLKWRAA